MKNNSFSSRQAISQFTGYLISEFNVCLMKLGIGCLEITVQCLTLDSLESLWRDYRSGHLSEVAERCLVTSEIKRELGLETITLRTTIKEDDYLACKKVLLENSRKFYFKMLTEISQTKSINWRFLH